MRNASIASAARRPESPSSASASIPSTSSFTRRSRLAARCSATYESRRSSGAATWLARPTRENIALLSSCPRAGWSRPSARVPAELPAAARLSRTFSSSLRRTLRSSRAKFVGTGSNACTSPVDPTSRPAASVNRPTCAPTSSTMSPARTKVRTKASSGGS